MCRAVVVRIDLLLIEITVCDRTVNMRSCHPSVEILSVNIIGKAGFLVRIGQDFKRLVTQLHVSERFALDHFTVKEDPSPPRASSSALVMWSNTNRVVFS